MIYGMEDGVVSIPQAVGVVATANDYKLVPIEAVVFQYRRR